MIDDDEYSLFIIWMEKRMQSETTIKVPVK